MASYSQPIKSASRKNNVLQRKLRAAFDRFVAADEETEAARKARAEAPECHQAIITIILDTLRTRL